jgi:acyl-CoA thioester hydrolase
MNSDSGPEPAGGWIEQQTHFFPVRVYYEDTDFSGFVYHASYLKFMERGRSEFLRMCGLGHRNLLDAAEPLFWTVRGISIRYARPARVEDPLLVRTGVFDVTGARMFLRQWIERRAEEMTRADVEVCLVSAAGRPRRIPELIRKQLVFYIRNQDNQMEHKGGLHA